MSLGLYRGYIGVILGLPRKPRGVGFRGLGVQGLGFNGLGFRGFRV